MQMVRWVSLAQGEDEEFRIGLGCHQYVTEVGDGE